MAAEAARSLSRQPSCGHCGHEEHIFFDCDWCLCQPHNPTGIYPDPPIVAGFVFLED